VGVRYDDLLMSSLLVLVCRYSLGASRELKETACFICFSLVSAIFAHKMVVHSLMAASFDSSEQQLGLE